MLTLMVELLALQWGRYGDDAAVKRSELRVEARISYRLTTTAIT